LGKTKEKCKKFTKKILRGIILALKHIIDLENISNV